MSVLANFCVINEDADEPEVTVTLAVTEQEPEQRVKRSRIDTVEWINYALDASLEKKRENRRSFKFMTMSSDDDDFEAAEDRRVRNELIGRSVWPWFEAYHCDVVLSAYGCILAGLSKEVRRYVQVSLAGNLANRVSAISGGLSSRAQHEAILNAFPPHIVNINVTVTHPEAYPDAIAAIDRAIVQMKRKIDLREKDYSIKSHSCVIVPNSNGVAVKIDVPDFGELAGFLPASAYSVCRNSSREGMMLTRLRKAVRTIDNSICHLPLVDVCLQYLPCPEMPVKCVQFGKGRIFVPRVDSLKAHFDYLLAEDEDVKASPQKMARCRLAATALATLRIM